MRPDPLCANSVLSAANASLEQWAEHWGNFLLRELARELCRPRLQQPKEQASAEPRPLTARIQEILFEVREGVSLAAITSRTQETEERCLSALEELQLLGAIYVDGQGMYAAL